MTPLPWQTQSSAQTLEGHMGVVSSFAPCGMYLAGSTGNIESCVLSVSHDRSAILWDLRTMTSLRVMHPAAEATGSTKVGRYTIPHGIAPVPSPLYRAALVLYLLVTLRLHTLGVFHVFCMFF